MSRAIDIIEKVYPSNRILHNALRGNHIYWELHLGGNSEKYIFGDWLLKASVVVGAINIGRNDCVCFSAVDYSLLNAEVLLT